MVKNYIKNYGFGGTVFSDKHVNIINAVEMFTKSVLFDNGIFLYQ